MSRQGWQGREGASERTRGLLLSRETILSLYLPAMALSLGQGIAAPVLPVFVKSFDVSLEVASLVIIIHGLGGLASTLPTGWIIDKVGRRPVLLVGPLLTALTSFATAFAQSFPELLVYRFIAGASAHMWQLSRLVMIADTGGDRERGRMITWMMETQRASHLFSPALGGFLGYYYDVRVVFIVHGVLTLLAIIPSIKLTKETAPPARGATSPGDGSASADMRYIISEMLKPTMTAFLIAQFLANVTRGFGMGGVLNLYAAYMYGVNTLELGFLATANSFLGLPIGFATGYIMDRWGRKKTIVPGFSLLAVALLFMASTNFFALSFEWFVAAYFAVHFTQGITGGNMQVLGSDLAPTYARGRFIAAWRLIADAGREISVPWFTLIGMSAGYWVSMGSLSLTSLTTALIVAFLIAETVGRSRASQDAADEAAAVAAAAKAADGVTASANGSSEAPSTTGAVNRDVPTRQG